MAVFYGKVRNHAYAQLFGQTSLNPVSTLRSANRTDWYRICSGAYRSELVALYKHTGLAERRVSFVAAVSSGQLAPVVKEIGVFESFRAKIIVTNRGSLRNEVGYRAWEKNRRFKKIMVTVDPCDEHWFPRLIHKILGHHERDSGRHHKLSVELYEAGAEKRLSSESRVLMGQLMADPSREVYALVEESSTVQTRTVPPAYVRKTLRVREVVKVVEQPVLSKAAARRARRRDRMIKAPLQSQQKSVLKMPEKPLEGIAKDLSERIAAEMYEQASAAYGKAFESGSHKAARPAVDQLIADPLFVHSSVAKALTDDSIYSKADPSTPTAAAYWSKRGANIGELINSISTSVARGVVDINAGSMFKPRLQQQQTDTSGKALPIGDDQNARIGKPFTGDIAKKAFSDATIGCGIWDCFMDWIGCGANACGDHGGPDLGPTNSVCVGHTPHYRCAPFHSHCDSLLPSVHRVPHRHHHHHHDDKQVIKQKVILRIHGARRKAKKHHHHGAPVVAVGGGAPSVVAAPVAGEDSDSSGDEEVSYDRAMRKQRGLPYRSIHSDGEDEDCADDDDEFCPDYTVLEKKVETTVKTDHHGHIDQVKYSNFMSLLKESGHASEGRPHVYLALDNSVLTASNMLKIRNSKEGCRGFIARYAVPCHKDAHSLHHECFRHPTLVGGVLMVSAAGVHFAAHAVSEGAHLVLAAGSALGHATLHAVHFLTCPILPHHVRFLPFRYLHHHFPKHGHSHSYTHAHVAPAHAHFDSPHVDI